MQALLMSDVLKAKSVFLVKMVFSKIPLIQMTSEDLTLPVPCISESFHTFFVVSQKITKKCENKNLIKILFVRDWDGKG